MSNLQKLFHQLSIEYQNFKVNPSKLSGNFRINGMYGLKADAEAETKDWKVYVSETGDTIHWKEVPETFLSTIKEFIDRWEQIKKGEPKDPIDTLKEHGFEDAPIVQDSPEEIPIDEAEQKRKMDALDDIMDKGQPIKKQYNKNEIQDAKFTEVDQSLEIVALPAPIGISGIVRPAVSAMEALAAWKEFQELKKYILEPSDILKIQGKNFIVKSGWRKFATFYNLTDRIVEENQIPLEKGFYWKIKVVCRAPNGRETEGVGMCASTEKNGARALHDCYSTAHTRAKNRAISDMIAAGEVSAEEMA